MNRVIDLLRSRRTFVLYCAIGATGVGCDVLIYSLLLSLGNTDYQWANAGGYLIGTIVSFILNARYNFKVRNRIAARFLLFGSTALLGYAISVVGLHLLVEYLRLDRYLAKVSTLAAVVLIQYNLNRLLSFRRTS